jgi:hypothetical protein
MKQIFATLIGLLFLSNYSLAQGTDTLKVIVLTPNHVEVSANCRD